MSNSNELARVEAYSDGIFAIAATLLVLEIKVPSVGAQAPLGELWHGLAGLWPSYLAFVISFGTILVMWVNHHNAIRKLKRISNAFLYANGFLLLAVTFVPFPTAVLARYIDTGFASVAVVFYACSQLLLNVANLVWFAAMQKPVYLGHADVDIELINKIWTRIGAGTLGYASAAIIGWWLPPIGLGVIVALYVLWIVMSIES
ncbi:MAG TPA: TMEM175 family protein [Candidatus Eremiobacteraceae bacterium]|nr:TMEM175 family protein [Candidatus Eremiobacteraceae bacterium]